MVGAVTRCANVGVNQHVIRVEFGVNAGVNVGVNVGVDLGVNAGV